VLISRDSSSLVIDNLCNQVEGQNYTVTCFYFDFAARNEQSPAGILGSLLKQLVFGLEEIPEEISKAYQHRKNAIGGQGFHISDILRMLQIMTSRKRAFICIDAIDECATEHQIKLLNSLGQLLQQSPRTRIFLTGRPHILLEIGKRLAGRVAYISISPKQDDIVTYLRSRLAADITPDAMDSTLEADILKKIPNDIAEMYVGQRHSGSSLKLPANGHVSRFLLVSLNIDAILQEPTIHLRRQRLGAMTDGFGLESVYGETLGRIKGQSGNKARFGIAALMWISHSERPLKADELCHALAVEIGSPNLNTDNVPSIGIVLICCQGLVSVDKETSTVRLIHFTLQGYLRAHPELFSTVHSTMAETCLTYLNSQEVRALSTSPAPDLQGTPFLEYSSLYWGVHAKRDLSDCAKLLASKLFDDYNSHISIRTFLKAQQGCSYDIDFDKPHLISGLHCASLFGIVEIVSGLIEVDGCDINQRDCVDNTPLVWAALEGHERVVEMLLKRGDVGLDKPGRFGQTPLFGAAWNGHEGVVKVLLERDEVNPDKPDDEGETPLFGAAQNGREGVVKMLLGRDEVNPDKPNNEGVTPLFCAAWNGHEGVVKILLERDEVNPDKPDDKGETPLLGAAQNGREGVVKMLLGRDEVNPDKPNNEGVTPLFCAAWNGHEGVVKMLLERDEVNPDKPNNQGVTPLFCAAWNGHEGVVKMLLGRDEVNPDKPDDEGETPLLGAAQNGREGVVKMLLGRDEVNPDKPNNEGVTPLFCAAWNGHDGVVKILLERDEVNPNKVNNKDRTPLWYASSNGHEGVVKMLLERDEVNPDKPDNGGETPLIGAAQNGHEGVVKMLLEQNKVVPDKRGNDGLAPLSYA